MFHLRDVCQTSFDTAICYDKLVDVCTKAGVTELSKFEAPIATLHTALGMI
jgi:hypothetical protein